MVKTHLIKQEMVQHELLQWAQHARAGARLQPERDLAMDMGVSRTTIRLAVDELVRIGVLKRIHGSGVYVNHADVATKYKVALVYFDDFGPMQNSLQLPVMQKAETAMINAEFDVVLIPVHVEEATHPNLQGVDAVLTLSRIDTSSLQNIIPIVSLFDPLCPYDNVICLLSDDYLLGKMATKYLLGLGHRRIAFVADTDDSWAQERYRGICDTTNELSIPQPTLIKIITNEPIGLDVAQQVASQKVSAVICGNDYVAMGMISSLHSIGLDVPASMSVIGVDDVPNAAFFFPPLTTIQQPIDDIITTAISELKHYLAEGFNGMGKKVILPSKLIERESCAPYTG